MSITVDPSIPVPQNLRIRNTIERTIKNNGPGGDGEVYGQVVLEWDENTVESVYNVQILSSDAAGSKWLQDHASLWPQLAVYLPAGHFTARVLETTGAQPNVVNSEWSDPISFCISTTNKGKDGTASFC